MTLLNKILVSSLLIQISILAIVFWPESEYVPAPILGDATNEKIMSVSITDAGGYNLKLTSVEGVCTLPQADQYPCKNDLVQSLIDKLLEVDTRNLVTKTSASHNGFRVADENYEKFVELEMIDGTTSRVFLGTSPHRRSTYVRAENDDSVYMTSAISAYDAHSDWRSWIDANYFSVNENDIEEMTLVNPNGIFNLHKGTEDKWTLKNLDPNETLDQITISSILNRASRLYIRQPLGLSEEESYGLQSPETHITVRYLDENGSNNSYRIDIGSVVKMQNGEDGRVIKYSESPYYVIVAKYVIDEFTEKNMYSFIGKYP